MSLQLLAKQMEAKGRNGDSVLVHMTPGEVEGLQKLAEAAGGSLSVNPETGLVEANFLKKLISSPMFAPLAGAGLMMIPGVGPMMAAGLVGGGTALATGDVGKGAMAGLGAYGGAGLAGGLMGAGNAAVSQAATAANPAVMGPMPGAATGLQAAKTGATSLGTEAGRQAFMQGVGGVGGLAKKASMATAPMMMDDRKQAEVPVDDEMYVYDFDYGRTGADSMPTSSSAERMQLNPTFSNRRKVRAKDYFNAAEGGEVAGSGITSLGMAPSMYDAPVMVQTGGAPITPQSGLPAMMEQAPARAQPEMTGASKAAFDYLMGNAASSAPQGITAPAVRSAPVVGSDNMYAFDPATGAFLRNPDVPGAATSGSRVGTSLADFGGGGGGYEPAGPNPDFDTPEKQAAYYAENPTMGAVTRAGQTALGFLPGGPALFAAQEYMDPGFRQAQENLTYGVYVDPATGMGHYAGSLDSNGGVSGHDYGGGGYDAGSGVDTSYGYGGYFAEGGITSLAKGGMKSGGFVMPADVVSMVGEGNTDAGYSRLKSMIPGATAIKGKDGGQADTVKTSIEGKQPARVAHGEMYIPPETVKRMGGAKKLYAMMDRVREQATGSKKQIKPVSLKRAMA
jgi:hypothetical protein